MKYKIIMQHDERDCGAACLAMIAAYHKLFMPLARFCEITKTDHIGTNLYGIIDGAKKIGFDGAALNGTADELLAAMKDGSVNFPFIAHTVQENDMLHYVVVYAYRNGKFIIGNPAAGIEKKSSSAFFDEWTGYIITFNKTNAFKAGNHRKNNLSGFFSLLKGQYKKLAGVMIISLLMAFIGILGTFVFQYVIDDFMVDIGEVTVGCNEEHTHEEHTHEEHESGEPDDDAENSNIFMGIFDGLESLSHNVSASSFTVVFVILISIYLFQIFIHAFRGYLIASLGKKIDIRLTLKYYNHVIGLPMSTISTRQTGEYLARFSDADAIRDTISGATVTILLDAILVIGSSIILLTDNPKLFVVSLAIITTYAIMIICFNKPLEKVNRNVMRKNASLQSYLKESIDGIETVKAANAEKQIKYRATSKYSEFINGVFKASIVFNFQEALTLGIETIGNVLVLWIGFIMVIHGQIGIGALLTFYMLLSFFTEPIKDLIELQPTIKKASISAERLNDILELEREDNGNGNELLPQIQTVKFENVSFRYANHELVLKNIDFEIKAGEKIAIVGESGSGKTTLVRLLMRFWHPETGCITFNEMPLVL